MKVAGLPHSEIAGSKLVDSSPTLIAVFRVLHSLLMPRHPSCARIRLARNFKTSLSRYVVILFNFQLPLFKDQARLRGERVHSISKTPFSTQGGFLKKITKKSPGVPQARKSGTSVLTFRLYQTLFNQFSTSIGPLVPICAGARFSQPVSVMAMGFSQRRPNVGEVTKVSIWNVMLCMSS